MSEYFIIKLCSRLFRRQGEVWMVKSSNGEGCYKHKKESGSVSIVFALKQMNMSFLLVWRPSCCYDLRMHEGKKNPKGYKNFWVKGKRTWTKFCLEIGKLKARLFIIFGSDIQKCLCPPLLFPSPGADTIPANRTFSMEPELSHRILLNTILKRSTWNPLDMPLTCRYTLLHHEGQTGWQKKYPDPISLPLLSFYL